MKGLLLPLSINVCLCSSFRFPGERFRLVELGWVLIFAKYSVANSCKDFLVQPHSLPITVTRDVSQNSGEQDLPPGEREGSGADKGRHCLQSSALLLETVVMFVSLGPLDCVLISLCQNPDPRAGPCRQVSSLLQRQMIHCHQMGKPSRVLNRGPHVLLYTLRSLWLLCRTANGQLRESLERPAWRWTRGPGKGGGWESAVWTGDQGWEGKENGVLA